MVDRISRKIFKQGSRTYFTSSWFFPRSVREDVFLLYGFVRSVDNYVDVVPQKAEAFYEFRNAFQESVRGAKVESFVIERFTELMRRKRFSDEWVEAFFRSMEMDLKKKTYSTLEETLEYIHGSAEVIGFMMACIMDLDRESFHQAGLLGRSMQYINFVRDIEEDMDLGRNYFPEKDMNAHGLRSLKKQDVLENQRGFREFIRVQLQRYGGWQREAEQGFRFIPGRCLIPIKTASDMYKWTAKKIEKDPLIVYKQKVKPSKARILSAAVSNLAAIRV